MDEDVNENSPLLENQQNKPDEILPSSLSHHLYHICSFAALIFACLLLLTFGTGKTFKVFRILFIVTTILQHAIGLVENMLNNNNNKFTPKLLLLSIHFHYIIFLLLISFSKATPILLVIFYIITLGINILNYILSDLIPLVGETDPSISERIRSVTSNTILAKVPAILDIILLFQYLVLMFTDFSFISILTFAVFAFWIVLFSYVTSTNHLAVWGSIGRWFKHLNFPEDSIAGKVIKFFVDTFDYIGNLGTRIYQ